MRVLLCCLMLMSTLVVAEPASQSLMPQVSAPQKLQALVELHTADELQQLLSRAEQIAGGEGQYRTEEPIAIVLHGQEIQLFKRSQYSTHKSLVDLAARLDAFNVVDLKVCQRWMGDHGVVAEELPAFLEPVPFGGAEVQRLQEAGYAFF
ncbi:hypothetical protein GCM10011297_26870 [Bacterioplanes sanyensis]|uniref:DsrE family protein n=1 Tax=Bacterioplanes sanyensis TaxID=1249553 RepID=UPI001674E586|nr:DsrE family protein [Bacterioplanes sanyensis]GGY52697.1 hypothetical protein GCM10011297_26870 [Bacterioplanes sanyensis]